MKKATAILALKTASTGLPKAELDGLRQAFPDVEFRYEPFDPSGIANSEDADVLYSYVITPKMFERMKGLKWFHSVVTGPDAYAFPSLASSVVRVTSPRGVYSVPIAETALGLMLALVRRIRNCIVAQGEVRWCAADLYGEKIPAGELMGSNALIVGLGGIGSALADRCRTMGMSVTGVVRSEREKPAFVDRQITFDDLRAELPSADFVVLCCPLTDQTRGMMGGEALELMKQSAYLINVARGELVDEDALVAALRGGGIAGAASDVFRTEPLPKDHPLYSAPNMIVMPHVSGFSTKLWERAVLRFSENLGRFLNGEELIGLVDFERGY